MVLSKSMQKFLDSLYYSEFRKYQSAFDKKHGYLGDKSDNKGLYTKLSKCLKWRKYENLYAVVNYLGWGYVDDEDYDFDVKEAMSTSEGCKKLISIDINHYKEMYEKYGY